jgi:hypothetical protein
MKKYCNYFLLLILNISFLYAQKISSQDILKERQSNEEITTKDTALSKEEIDENFIAKKKSDKKVFFLESDFYKINPETINETILSNNFEIPKPKVEISITLDCNNLISDTYSIDMNKLCKIEDSKILKESLYPSLLALRNMHEATQIARSLLTILKEYQQSNPLKVNLWSNLPRYIDILFDEALTKEIHKEVNQLLLSEICPWGKYKGVEESFQPKDFIHMGNLKFAEGNVAKANTYFGDAIYFYLTDFFYPQYIASALRANILEELDQENQSVEMLVEKLSLQSHMTDLLLRTLNKLDIVKRDGSLYSLSNKGKKCLKKKEAILLLTDKVYQHAISLPDIIKGKNITCSEEEKRLLSTLNSDISPLWELAYSTPDFLTNPVFPSQDTDLFDSLCGFMNTQIIATAVKLQLIEKIAKGVSQIDQLSRETTIPRNRLHIILQYLVHLHILEEKENRYSLCLVGKVLLIDNEISLFHGAHVLSKEFYMIWKHVLYTLKTGKAATDQVFTTGFFDYLDHNSVRMHLFGAYMGETMKAWLLPLSRKFPFKGKVIDLGGADGSVLTSILENNENITKAINFERIGYFEDKEPKPGIEQMEGDFFQSVPKDFDQYILSRVLWDWDDKRCITLLNNIQKVMPPKGRLIVVEALLDNEKNGRGNLGAAMFMPIVTTGKVRSLDEFNSLFNKSGLECIHHAPVHDSALSLSFMIIKKKKRF